MYKHLTYESTKDMTPEQWEEMRKSIKTIGGSDAPAIVGLDEYKSAYSLWADKTGKTTQEDLSGKEAIRLGKDLEQYVAERFEDATGKKLRRRNAVIHNPDYPFAHANVDRLVIGEDAGFEAKTTSSWEIAKQCKDGTLPSRYYVQVVHYLAITGAARWYVGVLCFGVGFFHFTVERDEAEIKALMDAESEFWEQYVETDVPPAPDGAQSTTDALKTIYADSTDGKSIDLTAVGHYIDEYNACGKQIKDLETLQEECANHIKDFMQDAERGVYGETSISWKNSTRKTFDKAAFEKANGKIGEQYYKTTESRSFRVTTK